MRASAGDTKLPSSFRFFCVTCFQCNVIQVYLHVVSVDTWREFDVDADHTEAVILPSGNSYVSNT